MSAAVPITFETLESALEWSSSGAPFENQAILSRASGELFLRSLQGEFGEPLPDDIEDGTAYIAVPHKNDFDLGRSLVLRFAEEHAPTHLGTIESFFRQRGAYAKFKALLERANLLERWYEYEATATRRVLELWAAENGFKVVEESGDA
jgi:hypothetical protein